MSPMLGYCYELYSQKIKGVYIWISSIFY